MFELNLNLNDAVCSRLRSYASWEIHLTLATRMHHKSCRDQSYSRGAGLRTRSGAICLAQWALIRNDRWHCRPLSHGLSSRCRH